MRSIEKAITSSRTTMKPRGATTNKTALLITGALSLFSLFIGGHVSGSLDHLRVSEILIMMWFSITTPVVFYLTFHDVISARSLALFGGTVLALSALSSKISKQYGSSTAEHLAIITHSYNMCEFLGMLFVHPSHYGCNNVTSCIGSALIIMPASRFDIRWLPANWQDDFRCAFHLSFTALLFYLIPSSPPLSREAIKEPRLRLWSYAVGFVGVHLVIFSWLQFRSSFESINMPSNPWYALIASLVFIGLNLIWLTPAIRTLGRVLKENRRIIMLRELDTSST